MEGRVGSGWLLTLGIAVTVAFQIFLAWQFGVNAVWMPLAFVLVALGAILLFVSLFRSTNILSHAAFSLLLLSMLIIPLAWSALTVTAGAGANLPAAYGMSGGPGGNQRSANINFTAPAQTNVAPRTAVNEGLLAYLEANTLGMKYLVAVESSQVGAPYVIATGRPVLYMGGFNGGDNVVSAEDLAQMVANGELRYVLFGLDGRNKEDVANWLKTSCTEVEQFSQRSPANNQFPSQGQGPSQDGQMLYLCTDI